MSVPADLSAAACPLLAAHGGPAAAGLVAQFNAAAAAAREAAADPRLGRLVASDEFRDRVLAPLAKVRGELGRGRYVVGFIGLTQAGKSTTVNNLLAEEVCKSGAGDATSSQPARLLRADRRALDVEFLDPPGLARRRLAACAEVGLASPGTDAEVLAALDDPKALAHVADRPRMAEDVRYLREFLRAAADHPGYVVGPPARTLAGLGFDRRTDYTAHGRGGAGTEVLLVREARLHLDNPRLPADMELCDLPGLDSKRSIDDIVTREYLPDLHGTFLFVNGSMNLKSAGMLGTLHMVLREFGAGAGGRVWLVFTKMDALTDNHYRPDGENVFGVMADLIRQVGIPPSQVCFCSNELFTELAGEPDPAAYAAKRLKQSAAKPVPDALPGELRPAWEALLADGGIGRIRDLMTGEVARTLAGQIAADAAARLAALTDDLQRRVQQARDRERGGPELAEKVSTCLGVVLDQWAELGRGPTPLLAQQGEKLRQAIGRRFADPATARVVGQLDAAALAKLFRAHARELRELLDRQVQDGLVDAVYDQYAQVLGQLPGVPLRADPAGCGAAWQGFRRQDAGGDWLPRDADPAVDEFAAWLGAADADGAVYLELMSEKVGRVVHQAVAAVAGRVRGRLAELKDDLMGLADQPPLRP